MYIDYLGCLDQLLAITLTVISPSVLSWWQPVPLTSQTFVARQMKDVKDVITMRLGSQYPCINYYSAVHWSSFHPIYFKPCKKKLVKLIDLNKTWLSYYLSKIWWNERKEFKFQLLNQRVRSESAIYELVWKMEGTQKLKVKEKLSCYMVLTIMKWECWYCRL